MPSGRHSASGQPAIDFAYCNDPTTIKQSFDVIDAAGSHSRRMRTPKQHCRPWLHCCNRTARCVIRVRGERLQQAIKNGQDFVKSGNYQSDADGIRLLRQNILKLSDGHPARPSVPACGILRDGPMPRSAVQRAGSGIDVVECRNPADECRPFRHRLRCRYAHRRTISHALPAGSSHDRL